MRNCVLVLLVSLAACSSKDPRPSLVGDASADVANNGQDTAPGGTAGRVSATGGVGGAAGGSSGPPAAGGAAGESSTGGKAMGGRGAEADGATSTGGAVDGSAGEVGGLVDVVATDSGPSDVARDVPTPDAADARRDGRPTDALGKVTVYVAGDSTVSTYTDSAIHQGGWGQFLQGYLSANATVVNKAVGGMTSRHFIEAGYLDAIVAAIKPGDYLLVQFGTNDSNRTATYTLPGSATEIPYYLDPETDYKTYLTKYVDVARAKNATTIFVTPPPRHSCNAGEIGVRNGLAAYAEAMKELGGTLNTPVVDLNAMVLAYLANVSCETSGSTFYLVKADGTVDSTHFQVTGADVMARLVAKGSSGIATLDVPLAAFVK